MTWFNENLIQPSNEITDSWLLIILCQYLYPATGVSESVSSLKISEFAVMLAFNARRRRSFSLSTISCFFFTLKNITSVSNYSGWIFRTPWYFLKFQFLEAKLTRCFSRSFLRSSSSARCPCSSFKNSANISLSKYFSRWIFSNGL